MTVSHIWTNDAPLTYEAAQARRIAWFNKVAPKPDWKAPIATWIDEEDFENCSMATAFFTGGMLVIDEDKGRVHTLDGKVLIRVMAPGYYKTIGA
jgi:hypothetical protein